MSNKAASPPRERDKGKEKEKEKEGTARRYAFACRGCKRRKARCDGAQPTCARCERLGETCTYTSGPSQQNTVEDLRDQLKEAHDLIRNYLPQLRSGGEVSRQRSYSTNERASSSVRGTSSPADREPEETDEAGSVADLVHHMSLDDAGTFQHYGSSSLLYQKPPELLVTSKLTRQAVPPDDSFASQPNWQILAQSTLSLSNTSQNMERTWQLLQTFFCWINPELGIVTESVFYRDLALSGPYYSRFLLCSICAHAARYSDAELRVPNINMPHLGNGQSSNAADCGASFLLEAKQLLMSEMERPTSIPTIQGLMILGLRELECGNVSLSWLYVGMAWRMLRDLGLHMASPQLAVYGGIGLPPADQEIRLRLFWAAFSFDKCYSICLGRSPTFNAYQRQRPNMISDVSEDSALWAPLSVSGATLPLFSQYTAEKAWTVSVAKGLASLSVITSEILMMLYVKRSQLDKSIEFLEQSRSRLEAVKAAWPQAIRLDLLNLPPTCPPPHILSLNLLYRGIYILLYRPFLEDYENVSSPEALQFLTTAHKSASQMSSEIDQLLSLHQKSFGGCHLSYIMLYCCYAAACIDVLDFLSNDSAKTTSAAQRLSRNLRTLEQSAHQSPSLSTTVKILKARLMKRPSGAKRERVASEVELPSLVNNSATSEPDQPLPQEPLSANAGTHDSAWYVNQVPVGHSFQRMGVALVVEEFTLA